MSNTLYCSFCRLSQHEVRRLMLGGPDLAICNECIDMMHETVHSEDKPVTAKKKRKR